VFGVLFLCVSRELLILSSFWVLNMVSHQQQPACVLLCAAMCRRDVSGQLKQLKGCSDVRKQQLQQKLEILGTQQVG
jgi:hypothetical protein